MLGDGFVGTDRRGHGGTRLKDVEATTDLCGAVGEVFEFWKGEQYDWNLGEISKFSFTFID